jgi:hypothetical protein
MRTVFLNGDPYNFAGGCIPFRLFIYERGMCNSVLVLLWFERESKYLHAGLAVNIQGASPNVTILKIRLKMDALKYRRKSFPNIRCPCQSDT